ncbi:MAG: PDZ domain-containing protein, partial [Acidobacteriota bacterium]
MLERLKLGILLASTVIVAYGLVGGLMLKVSAGDEAYRDLSVFTTVFSKVEDDYVEKPDMSKAMSGALHGMMEALDPFSSFVDAKTYAQLDSKQNGGCVGLVLSKRYSYGYVVAVAPVGPAHDNGIRVGDLIESIDGSPTVLMSLWEAEQRLRGS